MNRPTGVTVLSIIAFILGGLEILCGAVLALGMGAFGAALGKAAGGTEGMPAGGAGLAGILGALGAVIGIVIIVIGAIAILSGIGLWGLKNWGRIMTIIWAGLGLLVNVLGVTRGGAGMILAIGFIAFYGWALYYLFTADVKRAFRA